MELILLFLSVVAAGVPMVSYLLLMRWLDRYEREPLGLVIAAFAWGGVGAVLLSVIGSLILSLPIGIAADEKTAMFLSVSIVAPLVEEPAKALILLLLYRSRQFDNATDGFVYGAAAGLGFGMSENFLYFASTASQGVGAWFVVVIMRTLFTGLMHACATSMVGAALGWAKFSTSPLRKLALPLSLLAAMAMHALWNGLAMAPMVFEAGAALPLISFLLFPLEFIALFIVFQASLMSESSLIRRELLEEAALGTLPKDHVEHFSKWSARRNHARWTPAGVDGARYVELGTLLAFRRSQRAARPEDPYYTDEVTRLRAALQGLFSERPEP